MQTSISKGFLKVIIIGDSGVGKTSLLEAFNYKKISKSAKPTIGAEFTKRKVKLEEESVGEGETTEQYGLGSGMGGREVNLQIWDTAGQERFQSLCTSFYRGTDCCILVFDVTQNDSYENLNSWLQLFQQTVGDEQSQEIPIVVVGNKSDRINNGVVGKGIEEERVKHDWVAPGRCREYI